MSEQLLVMMLGVPGAGKSFFARNLAKEIGMTRINADEVRTRLYGSITATSGRPDRKLAVYNTVNREMEEAIRRGESVVRDNQNNHLKDRDMCRALAKEVGAQAVIVWVQTPKAIAIQRCMDRPATVDQLKLDEPTAQDFYNRSMKAIERPTSDEAVVVIDGTADFSEHLRVFSEQLDV